LKTLTFIYAARWSKEKATDAKENYSSIKLAKHPARYPEDFLMSNNKSKQLNYLVNEGDTIDDIAQRYGVPVDLLAHWNSLSSSSTLKDGQRLIIQILDDPKQIESSAHLYEEI
jgi:LysM repeat protein